VLAVDPAARLLGFNFVPLAGRGHKGRRLNGTRSALRGRLGTAQVGVITVVPEEMAEARALLGANQNLTGTPYYVAENRPANDHDVVILKLADRSNISANEGTRDLIEDFRPWFILLVGIGGGVAGRDGTSLGDVIVADYVDYYEFRKVVDKQNRVRPIPFDQPSLLLRERIAEQIRVEDQWLNRITVKRPKKGKPKGIVGNVISGEKLLGDPSNREQKRILKEFDKALAVDMESYGVARAVFRSRESVHYNPQYLVLRGVSDLVNEQGNDRTRQRWRSYAANAAAAFTRELIERLRLVTSGLSQREA
jgi:nucleoside phosphorylase